MHVDHIPGFIYLAVIIGLSQPLQPDFLRILNECASYTDDPLISPAPGGSTRAAPPSQAPPREHPGLDLGPCLAPAPAAVEVPSELPPPYGVRQ